MRLSTVKGAVVGGSLVYLLDPLRGAERRAMLRHRVVALFDSLQGRTVNAGPFAVGNRVLGRITIRLGRRKVEIHPQGPGLWEYPMTTVHIDVDDEYAMPGSDVTVERRVGSPHPRTNRPQHETPTGRPSHVSGPD